MKRITVNFLLDTAAFIAFIGITATGVILRWILPRGSGSGGFGGGFGGKGFYGGRDLLDMPLHQFSKNFLNLTRHQWGDIY